MPRIILHQWLISPFCAKVRKALHAKQLAFETVEYNGMRALAAIRLSPAGRLPVLDYTGDDGRLRRVQDSTRIIELLEREHPEPALLPSDPRERALAHVIEDWADEVLFSFEAWFRLLDPVASKKSAAYLGAGRPAWEGFVIRKAGELKYRRRLAAQGYAELGEAELERMLRGHLDAIEALLDDRAWLVGERQSIADIGVSAQLGEFVRTSRFADEILGRARLREWLDRNGG